MAPRPPADIGLREAAGQLGVHYMTAYRYVRTGALPATKVAGEWRVKRTDLERFAHHEDNAPGAGGLSWPTYREQLVDRLVAADEAGAWSVVERALTSGATPTDVHIELIAPALVGIGDGWADGSLSVADEHRASSIAARLVGRLGPSFARRGRKRGSVVVGAASGDHHAIPALMLGDVLRGEGFDVIDLGAHTPAESFVAAGRGRDNLIAIAISVAWAGATDAAAEAAAHIHAMLPGTPVFVGGPAVQTADDALALGADLFGATARDVADGCSELADERRREARRHRPPS